jgi:hypothetical protein
MHSGDPSVLFPSRATLAFFLFQSLHQLLLEKWAESQAVEQEIMLENQSWLEKEEKHDLHALVGEDSVRATGLDLSNHLARLVHLDAA